MPEKGRSSIATTSRQPCVQGRDEQAGTVSRVPANEVETIVAKSVRDHLGEPADSEDAVLIRDHVVRVEVQVGPADHRTGQRKGCRAAEAKTRSLNGSRCLGARRHRRGGVRSWCPNPSAAHQVRPIRSENRALLVASIARGRRWLDELLPTPISTVEAIAAREGCSERKVNMTISLAFLAPTSSRRPSKDVSHMAWAWPDSANCPPNGPASTTYSVSRRRSRDFEPVSAQHGLCFLGNGIPSPETSAPKARSWTIRPSLWRPERA